MNTKRDLPAGCERCDGRPFVERVNELGESKMARCECERGQALLVLDRERQATQT